MSLDHYPSIGGRQASPLDRPPPYRLVFPWDLWQRLHGYVQVCPQEVNGLGYLPVREATTSLLPESYDIVVNDVFILQQEVTGGSADVTAETVGAHITSMVRAGQNPKSLRLQWHSHVDMPAYFSQIDLDNIMRLGMRWGYIVSLVTNKRGEYMARLDVFKPFHWTMPLQVVVRQPIDPAVLTACADDVRQLVTGRHYGMLRTKRVPVTPDESSTELPIDASVLRFREP